MHVSRRIMKNQLGQLLLIEIPKAVWSPALERVLNRFQPAGVLFESLHAGGRRRGVSKHCPYSRFGALSRR